MNGERDGADEADGKQRRLAADPMNDVQRVDAAADDRRRRHSTSPERGHRVAWETLAPAFRRSVSPSAAAAAAAAVDGGTEIGSSDINPRCRRTR